MRKVKRFFGKKQPRTKDRVGFASSQSHNLFKKQVSDEMNRILGRTTFQIWWPQNSEPDVDNWDIAVHAGGDDWVLISAKDPDFSHKLIELSSHFLDKIAPPEHLSASAILPVEMSPADVQEFYDAAKILEEGHP